MREPLRCYDCGEPVKSPFMPIYLNSDGSEPWRFPNVPGDKILTQFCLPCAHWRYWAPRMDEQSSQ